MKKTLIVLLCLLLALSTVLVGCDKGPGVDPENKTEAKTDAEDPNGEGETAEITDPDLPAVAYNREIRIVQRSDRWREDWNSDKENGGQEGFAVLQQALFNRNAYLEEKYSIVLEHINYDRSDVAKTIRTKILADAREFDIIDMGLQDIALNSGSGMLIPMQQLETLNLDATYWYPELNESLSYRDVNFFLISSSNMFTLWTASCVWYNMDLASAIGIDSDIFEMVNEKTWTVENMVTLAQISHYLDQDSTAGVSNGDRFGIGQTAGAWYTIFYGSDLTMGEKDADGSFVINVSDERIVDLLEDMITYVNDSNITIPLGSGVDQWVSFRDGNVLFLVESIAAYNTIRHGDMEYSILPNPMLTEGQDRYYTTFHKGHSSCLSIPADVPESDYAMLGAILEDAAYMSRVEQWPAYYEVLLQGRAAQNAESAEIVELIFESLTMDPCQLFSDHLDNAIRQLTQTNGVGNITSTMMTAAQNQQNSMNELFTGWDSVIDKYAG